MLRFYSGIVALMAVMVILSACSDPMLDQVITRENVEASVTKLTSNRKPESPERIWLERLLYVAQGRQAFINGIFNGSPTLVGHLVADEEFKQVADALFKDLTTNQITYGKFIEETMSASAFTDEHVARIDALKKQIDERCLQKQREFDVLEKRFEVMKDSLQNLVGAKIIMIEKTKEDHRDVVIVGIMLVNKTKMPIDEVDVEFPLTRVDGTYIRAMRSRLPERITGPHLARVIYDVNDQPEVCKLLISMQKYGIVPGVAIVRVKMNGKTTEVYPVGTTPRNYQYTTPEELKGTCPYLKEEDELLRAVAQGSEDLRHAIAEKFPAFSKVQGTVLTFIR